MRCVQVSGVEFEHKPQPYGLGDAGSLTPPLTPHSAKGFRNFATGDNHPDDGPLNEFPIASFSNWVLVMPLFLSLTTMPVQALGYL
jgi:hypothetical protein